MYCAVPECRQERRRRCPKESLEAMSTKFKKSFTYASRLCDDHIAVAFSLTKDKMGEGLSYAVVRNMNKHKRLALTGISDSVFSCLLTYLKTFNQNVELEYAQTGHKESRLPLEDQLLITLAKLRTGQSDEELSVTFLRSRQYISSVWRTWLCILYFKLKETMTDVPSLKKCQEYLPTCFYQFPLTRIIIDCTEIATEKPSSLETQAEFYSFYKQRHTVKFMVGVMPCGVINYVSPVYPGGTTDKEIVAAADDLWSQFKPGENVMADKGFIIDDILPEGVTLNIPAGLWGRKKQYTLEESVYSRQVAQSRIHVERIIGYMKHYKILEKKLELSMMPYISKVVLVVACLVNLQSIKFRDLIP